MIASPAEIRRQTRQVVAFLRAACPVCLVPHEESIHAATLRIRRSVLLPPIELPARKTTTRVTDLGSVPEAECLCTICGAAFLNPSRNAKYCPKCKPGARLQMAARASRTQAERRKAQQRAENRGNRIATNGAVAPRHSA